MDAWPQALWACRDLRRVPEASLAHLLQRVLTAHGRAGAELALRSVALAEAKKWLPGTPIADAVRAAATPAPAVRPAGGVQAVPLPVVAHVVRHLPAASVAVSSRVCRDWAVAMRDVFACGELTVCGPVVRRATANADVAWFRARRPWRVHIRLSSQSAGVARVAACLWNSIAHLRVDGGDRCATLVPQRDLCVLLWPRLSCADVLTRTVVSPTKLRRLHVAKVHFVTAEQGRWWSRATALEAVHVGAIITRGEGLDAFTGFPRLRALFVDEACVLGSAPTSVAALQAVLVRSTRRLCRVDIRSRLTGVVRPLRVHVGGVGEMGMYLPATGALGHLLRCFARVQSLLVARVGAATPLVALCAAAAGRVRGLLVLQDVGSCAIPPSEDDVSHVRAHAGSVAVVRIVSRPGWTWRDILRVEPCAALGRRVVLQMRQPDSEVGAWGMLQAALPRYRWRRVSVRLRGVLHVEGELGGRNA